MIIMQNMLKYGTDALESAGIEDAGIDAWYLLSYCMDINKTEYYMRLADEVSESDYGRYVAYIERRASHEPLQYIIGLQEFMGLEFIVNESVLIPRQDTELLVELAIKYSKGKKVLDMCTGSGCIAVSIDKLGATEQVTAVDISETALKVAMANSLKNEAHVKLVCSDLWNEVEGVYDIIVSNPPYITDKEMQELMPEVGRYEPKLALEGGEDGLDFYRRIIDGAGEHIASGGIIMFEIGCHQAEAVSNLLFEKGFVDIRVEKDLAGLDRVVWAVNGENF